MKEKINMIISFIKEKITRNRRIKNILLFLSGNKRVKYLIIGSLILSFVFVFRVTYALFTQDLDHQYATIRIKDFEYSMKINEYKLLDNNGNPIYNGVQATSNRIVGDRILKLDPGETEYFLIELTASNAIRTKYEIIYNVCGSDDTCTSPVLPNSQVDMISVFKGINNEEYPDFISDTIDANGIKKMAIVTTNANDSVKYIQIGLNVGYEYNTLSLQNSIDDEYDLLYGADLFNLSVYIDDQLSDVFPNSRYYNSSLSCLDAGQNASTTNATVLWDTYNERWIFNLSDLSTNDVNCEAHFSSSNLVVDLNGGTTTQQFLRNYSPNTTVTLITPTYSDALFIGWTIENETDATLTGNQLTIRNQPVAIKANYGINYVFEYSGAEQTFTAPSSGTYKLEVWGAQGGGYQSKMGSYRGGYGGYSVGEVELYEGQKIFINVGGEGITPTVASSSVKLGGYNGGGNTTGTSSKYVGSGGGATHIALNSGLLSTFSTKTDMLLIVAGGGGGGGYESGSYYSTGGNGGGITGNNGTTNMASYPAGGGGKQNAGGSPSYSASASFGVGASTTGDAIGGGGGYYGGGAGQYSSGGGGGSGYIGNSLLTNKRMYCYSCATSNVESTLTSTVSCVNLDATQYCAKSGAGEAKITYTNPHYVPVIAEFDYSGDEQIFTASASGIYILEVWGAQGGNALVDGSINQTNLGYGGYATGEVTLNKGDKLYINVGGKGTNGTNGKDSPGGYNGGGKGTWDNNDNESSGGGGGATHIALESGLLTTFSSKVDRLLIVAGGGGGSSWIYSAGAGGGATGGQSSYTSSTGGGQSASAGHVFGQGQDANGTADGDGVGGGGGGYYGGSMYNIIKASSGTGGSGYIGNSLLSNKEMYCFNCGNNSNVNTKTTNTTQVSEAATTNKAKIGNGFVRITKKT